MSSSQDLSKKLFSQVHIFAGLSGNSMKSLLEMVEEKEVKAGEWIVQEGTPGREMFVIGKGKVEIVRRLPKEISFAVLETEDFFGEMSIVECRTRAASARALEDTLLFVIECEDLLRLFQKAPDQYSILILNIARDLSRRLRTMDESFAARSH